MNTPCARKFDKNIVTFILVFGFTTCAVMAQTTPNKQPPTNAAKPVATPVQTPTRPAVTTQNPNPPADHQANGQVGTHQQNSDRSVSNSQFLNNLGSIPTSQTGNTTPSGVGYDNPGGIVNTAALQDSNLNHVHYHYHYDSQGKPSGPTTFGYAPTTFIDPSTLPHTSTSINQPTSGPRNTGSMNVDAGNMFVNNPNSRVGGSGVATTWNPYLNNGAGMLTYGGSGGAGIQGFND